MKISKEEQNAIKAVVGFGKKFGYGNMISHLKAAWSKTLIDDHQFDEETAIKAGDTSALPVKMHLDIIERGEWDETGERYR